jgi:F-type H+-transporting ATPase subunit delta
MATNKSDPAAQQYAKALFMIGQEQKCLGQIYDDLSALTRCYREDPVFRNFFTSPKVPGELKQKVVADSLRDASEITRNFVALLIRKRREPLLDNIMDAFGKYRDEVENRLHVWVETATAMSDSERHAVVSRLSGSTGKTVVLTEVVRPELIGGMRIRMGDSLVDNSIATRLAGLTARLAELDQHSIGSATPQDVDELFERASAAS